MSKKESKKVPLYILHGWAVRSGNLNKEKWQPFIDLLESRGFAVTFLKIPGLSAPLDEVWGLDDFVQWAHREISQSAQGKKVILLGHSFGGQIAARLTAQYPELITKLILVDSAGIRDTSLIAIIKRMVFLIAAKIGKAVFQSTALRNILYKLAREQDYKNAPPLLRRTMSKILDDEILDDLPKISRPTQIIWGQHDKTTPVKHARKMHALIGGSRLDFITNARHSPQFTHPDQVAAAISEFAG